MTLQQAPITADGIDPFAAMPNLPKGVSFPPNLHTKTLMVHADHFPTAHSGTRPSSRTFENASLIVLGQ
jgi:hypothetical protein